MMSRAVMEARSRRLGLQHGNSVGRAVFLLKRQACRGILPNEDLPNQKCRLGTGVRVASFQKKIAGLVSRLGRKVAD